MFSKKMKYALKALIYIANKSGDYAKANEIAEKVHIPKKYLEHVLLELKKGGVINSKQGNAGGYYFEKDPSKITLSEVFCLMSSEASLAPCASKQLDESCLDCPNKNTCAIKQASLRVKNGMLETMKQIPITSLIPEYHQPTLVAS